MEGERKAVLAVDIGGSKHITGIVSPEGDILYSKRSPWRAETIGGAVDEVCSAALDAAARFPGWDIPAVGMTIPGLADPDAGIWVSSDFMEVRGFPIAEIVRGRLGRPVFIDNDCNACALAEKRFGTCVDCDDFIYVTVSTGVGSALFLNGALYRGAFGCAGELGECVLIEDGRPSQSNSRGTLETYASSRGLAENFLEAGGAETIGGEKPDGRSIAELASRGDPAALRAFELEGYYLGKMLAVAINLLDVKRVVIGGGLSLAFEHYRRPLIETVEKLTFRGKNRRAEILPTVLGYDGAFLGAAALAICGLKRVKFVP